MNSRPEIFIVTTVLLVPFLYYAASSIPDACAVIGVGSSGPDAQCTGKGTDTNGQKCCWTAEEGPNKGKTVCQTCTERCDAQGACITRCSPVGPAALKSTLPGL